MTDRMRSRGPDAEGIRVDARLGLAHRRLSVIDLTDNATQPMVSDDQRYGLVFNGEIYNYRQLREDLRARGYRFRSSSDTEVLLNLYRDLGHDMLRVLRGMFAFAIWDAQEQSLFCARDPYGIKPLYYSDNGDTLRVASQVKALLAGQNISREVDAAGIAGFYLFGHVPEPFTVYKAIRTLPAGCLLRCSRKRAPVVERYHSIAQTYRSAPQHVEEHARAEFSKAVRDSIESHMVSDVPVGVFLSSGLDSGCVLGAMRDVTEQPISSITLTFDEYRDTPNDEQPLAELVAKQYGSRHVVHRISKSEVEQNIDRFLDDMDQPSIDGLNTWLVSRVARQVGLKVVLSGVGGDELLGGYPSFTDIPRWVRMIAPFKGSKILGESFRHGVGLLRRWGMPLNPKLAGLFDYAGTYSGSYLLRRGVFMPWELSQVMGEELARQGLRDLLPLNHLQQGLEPDPGSPFARVASLESSFYLRNQLLRDADWAGMAHSVEIRTPFVDSVLLNRLAPILTRTVSNGQWKRCLAMVPSRPLPREVPTRKKSGFTLPFVSWLETLPSLAVWQQVSLLAGPRCHWARRWAYAVMSPHLPAA